MGTCRVSPDHNFLAYTVDITGSEHFMLQVKNLRSGLIIPKSQKGVVSLAWAEEGRMLFYTQADENQRPYRQNSVIILSLLLVMTFPDVPFFLLLP